MGLYRTAVGEKHLILQSMQALKLYWSLKLFQFILLSEMVVTEIALIESKSRLFKIGR